MNPKEFVPKIEDLMGKTVLIGITELDESEEVIKQTQYVGTFTGMSEIVHITLSDGSEQTLPPDLSVFQKAEPGIYRLRSTGEEINNPDFTASWTIYKPTENWPTEN